MLATRGDHVPAGAEWTHEVKWDGVRALTTITGSGVRIAARSENDITLAYPELQGLAAVGRDLLLDGEIVALGSGRPSFSDLAERMHVRDAVRAKRLAATNPVTLIVFDLLSLDGEALLNRPLVERRERLLDLGLDDVAWQVPPAYDDGAMLLDAAEQQGLEGIVSKRLSSLYRPGARSRDWLKFPIRPTGSFVVGGWRPETGSAHRIGALHVGQPTPDGLVYRGRVGSGVAGKAGRMLTEVLAGMSRDTSPFATDLPRVDAAGSTWVEPVLVVDVEYLMITGDGRLRQPSYRGVRTDLTPEDLQ